LTSGCHNIAFITYSGAVFVVDDMLNVSALLQTTNIDEIARKNFLGSQALAVFNFILPDNLLIHGQPNAKALWAYLWTLMETSSSASIFADY